MPSFIDRRKRSICKSPRITRGNVFIQIYYYYSYYEKILKSINCVSVQLQYASILFPSTINVVNSTKNDLNNLRNNEVFSQLFEKSKKRALKYDFIIDEDE